MKKRHDKRRLMEFKLNSCGITNYTFFEGIDGTLNTLDNIYNAIVAKKWFTSRGALGLIMTYIELLKDIYMNDYDNVLILEDDVNIHVSYESLLKLFDNTIKDEKYDIVWLGANQTKMSKTQFLHVVEFFNYELDPCIATYGTFSIVLKRSGVEKMMRIINSDNIKNLKPIDLMLNNMIAAKTLNGIVCYPYVFLPDVTESDNIGPRNQHDFAISRGYKMNDYHYISYDDYTNVSKFIHNNDVKSLEMFRITLNSSMLVDHNIRIRINRIINFIERIQTNNDLGYSDSVIDIDIDIIKTMYELFIIV